MKVFFLSAFLMMTFSLPGQSLKPVKKGKKYIYVDSKGDAAFDQKFENARKFSENRAAVRKKDKWGFIDRSGNLAIPHIYDEVMTFRNQRSIASIGIDHFLIDLDGKEVVSKVDTLFYISPEWVAYRESGLYGIINFDGEKLTNADYSKIEKMYNGRVTILKNGIWGTWSGTGENFDHPEHLTFSQPEFMPIFDRKCLQLEGEKKQTECSRQSLLNYTYQNLRYPKTARDQGIEGMAVAQFIITSEGKISDIKIVRKLGGGLDEEVTRIIENMNDWAKPAYQNDHAVNMLFTLPIRFKLQ